MVSEMQHIGAELVIRRCVAEGDIVDGGKILMRKANKA
jgi:hypothetical protein